MILRLSLIVLLLSACSQELPDPDANCDGARPLPTGLVVKDSVDDRRDLADCKQFEPISDGTAHVSVQVGTAFTRHQMVGMLTVYDRRAVVLDRRQVTPADFEYEIELPVQKRQRYFVELRTKSGSASYTVQAIVTAPVPIIEEPKVDPPQPDNDPPEETTRPPTNRCKPKCRAGRICVRGRCKIPPGPVACRKGCKPGLVCVKGACVPPPVPEKPPIKGNVTQIVRDGDRTQLTINRGKSHKVTLGMDGTACGKHRLRVVKVFEYRSKAHTRATVRELGKCRKVALKRK